MSEEAIAAILALVVGLLPVLLVGLIIVAFVLAALLLFLFIHILEQPIRCWFYYASVILDVVVLVPLWLISLVAMNTEPELWTQAQVPVLIFSGVLLVPTVILNYVCQKVKQKQDA